MSASRIRVRQPVSFAGLVLLFAGAVFGLVLLSNSKMRERAGRDHLWGFEHARTLYASRHTDGDELHPPFTMQLLIDEQYIGAEAFHSLYGPASDGRGDYWFNPLLVAADDADRRIASYDRAMYEFHTRVAVCFYDEDCLLLDIDEFIHAMSLPANADVDFDLPASR